MTTRKLKATLQRDYYGKAIIFEDDDFLVLRSYNTNVIAIDKEQHKIVRLWCGYSRTTQKHINDFLKQNGFKMLSKKDWFELPCINNEPTYNYYISNGFFTHKSDALLTQDECENTIQKIRENDINKRLMCWYD